MADGLLLLITAMLIFAFVIVVVILTTLNNNKDRLEHPEEYRDAGSAGERVIYNTLVKQYNIPEQQILRNVYIPIGNDKTTEIDFLVISKKAIFVFECKNYGGNIYGDARRQKWIQYIGNEKHYFYNPLKQNKNHAIHLQEFLNKNGVLISPVIPVLAMTLRGKWKVKNTDYSDFILGVNCHFGDIYKTLPESDTITNNFDVLIEKLTPLSRPSEEIKEKHIEQVSQFNR